jgi:hypothetical protein
VPNIAIVWDFDGTLTPIDSTTKVVEILAKKGSDFWNTVKSLRGDSTKPKWEHVLAMDAPIWMYALSRIAFERRIPLNAEFFGKFVKPRIDLYPNVPAFLRKLKLLEERSDFKRAGVTINYFIITAGLKHLVEQLLPDGLITWTFGCCYQINAYENDPSRPESIPTFCMDETVKTRSLFEISKGSFQSKNTPVNKRVPEENRWAQFRDIIYIGDGDTDIPSLSLVRSQGGAGVVVYNPDKDQSEVQAKFKSMRLDKRADFITPADFSPSSDLFDFLRSRCIQIARRHCAELA